MIPRKDVTVCLTYFGKFNDFLARISLDKDEDFFAFLDKCRENCMNSNEEWKQHISEIPNDKFRIVAQRKENEQWYVEVWGDYPNLSYIEFDEIPISTSLSNTFEQIMKERFGEKYENIFSAENKTKEILATMDFAADCGTDSEITYRFNNFGGFDYVDITLFSDEYYNLTACIGEDNVVHECLDFDELTQAVKQIGRYDVRKDIEEAEKEEG